jgi:hypothetical protein
MEVTKSEEVVKTALDATQALVRPSDHVRFAENFLGKSICSSAVFYADEPVPGGGTIERVLH